MWEVASRRPSFHPASVGFSEETEPDAFSAAVGPKAVAEAAYCLQRPHAEWTVDFFPEIPDVHLNDVGSVLVTDVPGGVQQLIMTENLAGAAHEGPEERELPS